MRLIADMVALHFAHDPRGDRRGAPNSRDSTTKHTGPQGLQRSYAFAVVAVASKQEETAYAATHRDLRPRAMSVDLVQVAGGSFSWRVAPRSIIRSHSRCPNIKYRMSCVRAVHLHAGYRMKTAQMTGYVRTPNADCADLVTVPTWHPIACDIRAFAIERRHNLAVRAGTCSARTNDGGADVPSGTKGATVRAVSRIATYVGEFDSRAVGRAVHILGAASSCYLAPDTFLAFGDGPRLCRPADADPLTRQAVHARGRHNHDVGTIGVVPTSAHAESGAQVEGWRVP
jgi:hypothetical protein